MTFREYVADCFQNCRENEDTYGIYVNARYSLFVTVQENPDYDDGKLEYFIELNDTSSGSYEPCASYNVSCSMNDLDEFEYVIFDYLSDNQIYVEY